MRVRVCYLCVRKRGRESWPHEKLWPGHSWRPPQHIWGCCLQLEALTRPQSGIRPPPGSDLLWPLAQVLTWSHPRAPRAVFTSHTQKKKKYRVQQELKELKRGGRRWKRAIEVVIVIARRNRDQVPDHLLHGPSPVTRGRRGDRRSSEGRRSQATPSRWLPQGSRRAQAGGWRPRKSTPCTERSVTPSPHYCP